MRAFVVPQKRESCLCSANLPQTKKRPDTQQINPDLIQYQRRNTSAVFAMLPTVALSHATLE